MPPIADNTSINLAALSLVILSNVGVSKKILTNLRLLFHSYSEISHHYRLFTDRVKAHIGLILILSQLVAVAKHLGQNIWVPGIRLFHNMLA